MEKIEELYLLIENIKSFKLEKFGLDKNNRIYIEKICNNKEFLDKLINKINIDNLIIFLDIVLIDLQTIHNKLENIINIDNEKIKQLITDLESKELEKEEVLNKYIKENKI